MITSIRVRLTGGPFDGETHQLGGFNEEFPPSQIEFVVLDEIGIPDHCVDTAKYAAAGEPVKVKRILILPYSFLDPNPIPSEVPLPKVEPAKPVVSMEAQAQTDGCPFEPGSFHQYPLNLSGKDQKIVYRVLGHLPGYWFQSTTPK